VKVKIVSLGRHWRGCRVILRPQFVAEAVTTPQTALSSVSGTVVSVTRDPYPSFMVALGGTALQSAPVQVAFDGLTTWRFSDDVLAGSSWAVDVANEAGEAALRERAIVEVQGALDAGGVFRATDIAITFPDVLNGVAYRVWEDGPSFELSATRYTLMVFPQPDPSTFYYDNADETHAPMQQGEFGVSAIVKVRGYLSPSPPETPNRMDAYWISWNGVMGI
jgi:hypothetical protein